MVASLKITEIQQKGSGKGRGRGTREKEQQACRGRAAGLALMSQGAATDKLSARDALRRYWLMSRLMSRVFRDRG